MFYVNPSLTPNSDHNLTLILNLILILKQELPISKEFADSLLKRSMRFGGEIPECEASRLSKMHFSFRGEDVCGR